MTDCLEQAKNTDAAMVVYDVTDFSSFHSAQRWIDGPPLIM